MDNETTVMQRRLYNFQVPFGQALFHRSATDWRRRHLRHQLSPGLAWFWWLLWPSSAPLALTCGLHGLHGRFGIHDLYQLHQCRLFDFYGSDGVHGFH